ncbi:Zn-dependent hydrolase [Thermobispora bispora]|uniref:Beta-lactamase domain protein n=1 Tax=Thermobispora bispora (strain ATCC 19993 / DSM 43833 / CBS 139.67 / JCM 10125 / KCTC 9307 / NBRC 14880 / R51) TaxID=469371 RepID=D6YB30_THEBD|nr:MBL fold metallo-hydrolase [Thermobispora bispora]ADG88390.1 beta-lactamase domain protein [Thermobispora bispora DSM 43833]
MKDSRSGHALRLLGVLFALAGAGWLARDIVPALGARPAGERARRIRRSERFGGGRFRNPVPTSGRRRGTARAVLGELRSGPRRPRGPVPLVTPSPGPASDLDVVWYGHASVLIEIEGRRVLFDPVWSERCSPSPIAGPRRLHPAPVPLAGLPELDAIVISHDHYDHLDMATVRELTRLQRAPFAVPLGVGAHLERWGVPASRIIELDWDEETKLSGLRLTATAARHFSGRFIARNPTLWASWVVAGERRRVFYTGDSGYFDGYAAIGRAYGPFDLSVIQIGAYSAAWPDVHMTPEEAVRAHLDLRAGLLLPVHWGTFRLAPHSWSDPVERLCREARAHGVRLAVPRPGERVSADDPPPVDGWWREIA